MNELSGWNGVFNIFIKSIDDDWTHVQTIKNTITNNGLNLLRDSLRGTITDAQIKYIAVGSSTTAVLNSDTQLGAEFFRKQVYTRTAVSDGVLQTISILSETEAVAQIEEIGVFAGSTASITANTGIMISRILYSRNKTNLESVQIQRTDTIVR